MDNRVVVGAHPWVHAARWPGYDISGILEAVFADLAAAGLAVIERAHESDFQPTRPIRQFVRERGSHE